MPDGSDPGRAERYAEREIERIRRQVPAPNKTDILHTIREGRRGKISSPKPRQNTKDSWSHRTVQNNARKLRDLAAAVTGLEEADYEGTSWGARPPRDGDYPDSLLDLEPDQVEALVADMAIENNWKEAYERDFLLTFRNHFLAHDRVEDAQKINYPQVGQSNVAVDIETVPTREDLHTLIEGESIRDKALFTLLWETGNRVTAYCSLKIKHWHPRGDGYGIIRVPGHHVTGLKGAEHSAKPVTFARGYLDQWLDKHPLSDDPDAPLFCPTRAQDDPTDHLHPHSIRTQITRVARRTEGIDPTEISPHTLKHGRATEMRASDKYDKDDIEQILDCDEGTPMHSRYAHVTEEEEAERILRKHGFEPAEGGDAVEQHPCPRCGTMVTNEADYCPKCSLRQDDGRPEWWRIYRRATTEDDAIRQHYDDDLAPTALAQLPPAYYEHALDVFSVALLQRVAVDVPGIDDAITTDLTHVADEPDIDAKDAEWLRENYPQIEEQHQDEHPATISLRASDQ